MNKLVSNPPMAKVTLNGAIAQIKAEKIPTLSVAIKIPNLYKIKQAIPSRMALRIQEIIGNGADSPPNTDPTAVSVRVYRGVVVPRTCSPGLKVKPLPAMMLRAYL